MIARSLGAGSPRWSRGAASGRLRRLVRGGRVLWSVAFAERKCRCN